MAAQAEQIAQDWFHVTSAERYGNTQSYLSMEFQSVQNTPFLTVTLKHYYQRIHFVHKHIIFALCLIIFVTLILP